MLVIANLKMNLGYHQEVAYITDNIKELQTMGQVVICPSFVSLATIAPLLKNSSVSLGAQTCSAYNSGSHTGQVSAQSLQEIGVHYCIVGHSEDRALQLKVDQALLQNEAGEFIKNMLEKTFLEASYKAEQLLNAQITPIVCISEIHSHWFDFTQRWDLSAQIDPLKKILLNSGHRNKKIYLAYEPLSAIGTGKIPDFNKLSATFIWLQNEFKNYPQVSFLYGGSVDKNSVIELKQLPGIAGFLVGKASVDFQQFKKIVSCL